MAIREIARTWTLQAIACEAQIVSPCRQLYHGFVLELLMVQGDDLGMRVFLFILRVGLVSEPSKQLVGKAAVGRVLLADRGGAQRPR